MKKIIENVKFIQDGTMVFGDLHLKDGFVERIDYKTPHMTCDIAVPGFVDLHTHGFHSHACDNVDPTNLKELALAYAKRGITSFCATLSARSLKEYEEIILAYRNVFQGETRGAQFEGFHLEGPYLNPKCCGAQKKEGLSSIHLGELEAFLSKYHDDIRIMTIAPELEHAIDAISLLNLYGIQVSLGHTEADFEQTKEAFEAGATQITHLGNTMPTINHRKETMMDAVFLSDVSCEIIMDRVHMQKAMLTWIIQLLGTKRIIAVDDGTIYSGYDNPEDIPLEDGLSIINHSIYKGDTLFASCCDLLDIFTYLYQEAQYDLIDCIAMCSTNAGKILKSYTTDIGLGKKVNLTILDHNLNIRDVIINGKSCM